MRCIAILILILAAIIYASPETLPSALWALTAVFWAVRNMEAPMPRAPQQADLMAAWLKHAGSLIEDNRKQLALLESGTMKLRQRTAGSPWKDTTDEEIARLKRIISELETLVTLHLRVWPEHP
jgi:hypothetical protein